MARAAAPGRSRSCSSTSPSTSTSPGARRATRRCRRSRSCRCSTRELEQARELARAAARRAATCWSRCATLGRPQDALVLHPVGTLRVSQRVVPLDLTIDKVGNQKPSDVKQLQPVGRRRRAGRGGRRRASSSRRRSSSDLDDADKLSQPAFERRARRRRARRPPAPSCAAGAAWSSAIVRYEQIIIDTDYRGFARPLLRRSPGCSSSTSSAAPRSRSRRSRSAHEGAAAAVRRTRSRCGRRRLRRRARRRQHGVRGRRASFASEAEARASTWPSRSRDDPTLRRRRCTSSRRSRSAGMSDAARHLLVPAVAAAAGSPTRSPRPISDPASRLRAHGRRRRSSSTGEQRRRRHDDAQPIDRDGRSCTARATSSASSRARSSGPSRATGSPTSSRTTCRSSSSTTRTSRGATRPPRRRAAAGRLRPWLALVVLDGGRVRPTAATSPAGRCRSSTVDDAPAPSRRPTSCGRGRTCTSTATLGASDGELVVRRHGRGAAAARRRARARTPTSPTRGCSARGGCEPNTRLPRVPGADVRDRAAAPASGSTRRDVAGATALGVGDYAGPAGADEPSRTTTAGSSAPARRATSSTSCACSSRGRSTSASARATWTCSDPAPNLPGIDRPDARRRPAARRRAARAARALHAGGAGRASSDYENWARARTRTRSSARSRAFVNLADDYARRTPPATPTPPAGARPGVEDDPDPLITPPLYGRWHALTQRLLTRARRRAGRPRRQLGARAQPRSAPPRGRRASARASCRSNQEDVHGRRLGAGRRRARGQPADPRWRSSRSRSSARLARAASCGRCSRRSRERALAHHRAGAARACSPAA